MLIPKYDDFMLPTLKALDELGGSASIEEIQDKLVERLRLTSEQMEAVYAASGAPIAPDRMSWARSYMKTAGLLASGGRGIWVLTDEGPQAALLADAQVRRIVADAANANNAKLIARRKERQAASLIGGSAQVAPDDDEQGTADESTSWTDRLLATLRSMDPAAFERLAQRLLRESGFVKVEVTGKTGDGGIDGAGVLRMNLISFQVLFQCKRYAGSVAAGTVRDFRGAMQGRADKGLIITTGTFTADARREATRDGAPAIDLIDGDALCLLLKERQLGVTVRQVVHEEIAIDATFFDDI